MHNIFLIYALSNLRVVTVSWREQRGKEFTIVDTILGIFHTYLILTIQRDRNYYLHLADEETNVHRGCHLPKVIAR